MTNNTDHKVEIFPWEPPTLRSEALIGKRVHDTREQFGDGTVIDYDVVEALVNFDTKWIGNTWVTWNDLEFIAQ